MNEITQQQQQAAPTVSQGNGAMINAESFDSAFRFASLMADGKSTLPKHLHGNPADCMAVVMQAMAWGMNPYAVAQKTHLVNGALGYEAQLVSAVVSSSTAIEGRFHYEYSAPDTWEKSDDKRAWVKCGAILKGEREITWGEPVFPAKQAVKNSPLWKTDPRQQTSYLALKKWARLYCPAVMLGVYTTDELQDVPQQQEKDITPKASAMRGPETAEPEQEAQFSGVDEETGEIIPTVDDLISQFEACTTTNDLERVKGLCVSYADDKPSFEKLVAKYRSMRDAIAVSSVDPQVQA